MWLTFFDSNGGKRDENTGFDNWWDFTEATSIELKKNEPLNGVGLILK